MKDIQIQLHREAKLPLSRLRARILSENRYLWEKKRTLAGLYGGLCIRLETEHGVTWVVFKKPGSYGREACYVAVRLADYWTFLLSEEYRLWRVAW